MRIAIASDHAAVAFKAALADRLRSEGHEIDDLGTDGEASVDHPDFGYKLAAHLAAGKAERGIAICGSGIGISIAVELAILRCAARWCRSCFRRRCRVSITTLMSSRSVRVSSASKWRRPASRLSWPRPSAANAMRAAWASSAICLRGS